MISINGVPDGYQLAITTDTLVSGVHFSDIPAKALGHRVIAVNPALSSHGRGACGFRLALTPGCIQIGSIRYRWHA